MEPSLHEVLDLDVPVRGLTRGKFWEDSEALVRVIEQRKDADEHLRAMGADLKAALENIAQYARKLGRVYADADEEKRRKVAPFYIRALFDAGREADAFEVIGAARRMRLDEPIEFAMIGGGLLKHGHYADAARWYTKGLVRHAGSLTGIRLADMLRDDDTAALARGRRTARHALGVAPDHLDEMYDRYQAIVAPGELDDAPDE